MSIPVGLPNSIRIFIARYLPEVWDLDKIQFRVCRRIPFWWVHGNDDRTGLTLWNRVYLRSEYHPIEPSNIQTITLIFHELTHVLQFRKSPVLFPIKYLVHHFRYGYQRNPAEVEARERAASLVKTYFGSRPT
jgi:hypothetical protein